MGINPDTYHRDHWVAIDDERLARYEEMFAWGPERGRLLDPLELAPGQTVVDIGAGPGFVSLALAEQVGPDGHVHGLDVNQEFVRRAAARADEAGLAGRTTFHHVTDARIPLPDASADRVLCKNVLEYVPDYHATLAECRRVLKPGGLLYAIDSDWGLVVLQPLDPVTVTELFLAAGPAFREPYIGRRLPGALRRAGFQDIDVRVQAGVDQKGASMPIVRNIAGYVTELHTMRPGRVEGLLQEIELAVTKGDYLFVLPQFLITARA